jgi:hypothetical protein
MRRDIGVEYGNPLPLGRILGQAFEPRRGPQAAAFGFERFEIQISHGEALGGKDGGR